MNLTQSTQFDVSIHEDEGQLALDVFENNQEVIIVSAIAGANIENLDISVHNDLLTIRGERLFPASAKKGIREVHHTECFWGKFSRTVVLPVDVNGDKAKAEYNNGILVLKIPKRTEERKISVIVVDE
jgi:HSP20 family protein